jgi:hypothetical protein
MKAMAGVNETVLIDFLEDVMKGKEFPGSYAQSDIFCLCGAECDFSLKFAGRMNRTATESIDIS